MARASGDHACQCGRRPRGRPWSSWRDYISQLALEDCGLMEVAIERSVWSSLLKPLPRTLTWINDGQQDKTRLRMYVSILSFVFFTISPNHLDFYQGSLNKLWFFCLFQMMKVGSSWKLIPTRSLQVSQKEKNKGKIILLDNWSAGWFQGSSFCYDPALKGSLRRQRASPNTDISRINHNCLAFVDRLQPLSVRSSCLERDLLSLLAATRP